MGVGAQFIEAMAGTCSGYWSQAGNILCTSPSAAWNIHAREAFAGFPEPASYLTIAAHQPVSSCLYE